MIRYSFLNLALSFASITLVACSGDGTSDGESTEDVPQTPIALNLIPWTDGNSWTYQLPSTEYCVLGDEDTWTMTLEPANPVDGFEVKVLGPWYCRGYGESLSHREGEVITWGTVDGAPWLGTPVEEGVSWSQYGGQDYVWGRVPSISVPAGSFTNCWARIPTRVLGSSATETYCPDVGLVQFEDERGTIELVSFELN